MGNTLSKKERLHTDTAINRLFKNGKGGFAHPFRYFYIVRDNAQETTTATECDYGFNLEVGSCDNLPDISDMTTPLSAHNTTAANKASKATGAAKGEGVEDAAPDVALDIVAALDTAADALKQESDSELLSNYPTSATDSNVAVLFSVPKKMFKRANKRNLLKRRGREAYRQNKQIVVAGAKEKNKNIDIALIYSIKEIADYKTIEDGIKRILATVAKSL